MSQLHGVETIELTSGTVAVTTIQTAIIGLVGTAPDASGEQPHRDHPVPPFSITLSTSLQPLRGGKAMSSMSLRWPDSRQPKILLRL
ncbi:phage tail sheath protein [Citrobacter freundii]|nr:phage tail sheath protein [Citrobacter freundii]